MALVLKDRVKETTTTTGTGAVTLAGASTGFQSFAAIGDGNETYYVITDVATGDWEVGIGTYTAAGPTLSRTTVLSSSNTGSLVSFGAGPKDVFVSYPSSRAVYQNTTGTATVQYEFNTLNAGTANISTANITAGTVSTAPTSGTDLVNKTYVDTVAAAALHYHEPVFVESPNTAGNLNATYNNGVAGVGATLTNAGPQAALTLDGVLMTVGKRVLIYNQTNAFENGVYTVTTVGSGSTNWVLTRATDADTYAPSSPNSLGQGDAFFVTAGNTGAGETYVCNTVGPITFGTTPITFVQISDATVYTASNGVTLNGTNIELTPTGTAGTYGSASAVPVLTTNAYGQITSVTPTTIAISGSAVSGDIAGKSGGTTSALTAGTYLTSGGTFDGSVARTFAVDATSANTASKVVARDASGNFSAGTITAALSGNATTATTSTNLAGGAANRIAYQTSSGITDFITAPSASNQVLNWNGSSFTWSAGTISGIPLGSNLATLTLGSFLTGTSYNGSTAVTAAVDATSANTANKVVARDASGNFSAGTITASLSGNASTASQVNNSATFNDSGLGDVSGTTFNGSAARTISYNTVGAPSTTGTNATGTWGINISGNAATASGLSSTLGVSGGGTGLTSLAAGYIPYGNGTSPFGSSVDFRWDSVNSRLAIGGQVPQQRFELWGDMRLSPSITQQNTIQNVSVATTPVTLGPSPASPYWFDFTLYTFSSAGQVVVNDGGSGPLPVVGSPISITASNGAITLTGIVASASSSFGALVLDLTSIVTNASPYYSYGPFLSTDVVTYNTTTTTLTVTPASLGWISSYTYISIGGQLVAASTLTVGSNTIAFSGEIPGLSVGDVVGSFPNDIPRRIFGVADDNTTKVISFNPTTSVKRWSVGGLELAGSGGNFIAIGYNAARQAQDYNDGIFIGNNTAGSGTGVGSQNTAVGEASLFNVNGGSGNVALGIYAGYNISTGGYNTALGYAAMGFGNLKTADYNTAVGVYALNNISSGGNNTGLGYYAGNNLSTGVNNTFVGQNSGLSMTTGSYNLILGSYSGLDDLDITTSNNFVVLSNGNSQRRLTINGSGAWAFNATGAPSYGSAGQILQSNGAAAVPTWVNAPVANNGTLTLNVSGIGLSGSQTFTANQATNATFTVTSNATNANTASTIVARDASGNFSAGTITANLNGNASTATTASNVNNGTLTLAVSGTGLSGSQTFTANQSTNVTFTVTSNATNTNTASAIVARDANGDFQTGNVSISRGLTDISGAGSPILRVTSPGGAAYYANPSATGAIQIQLPTGIGTSTTMFRMRVAVWTNAGDSFDMLCGAQLFNGGVASNFAYMLTGTRAAINTRWGWDGSRWSLFIGDIGNVWQYPVVGVTDVQVGFGAATEAIWRSGWNITVNNTSYGTVYAGPTSVLPQQQQLVSGTSIRTINGNSLLGSGNLVISGTPAGSNQQIQFNNSGSFGGSSNLTWDGSKLLVGSTWLWQPNSFSNVAVGNATLTFTSSTDCTAVGASALAANTSGYGNTAVGRIALDACTTGGYNTAVGVDALGGVSTGNFNTAVGYQSLRVFTGSETTAFGNQAGLSATTGSQNTFVGAGAALNLTSGAQNTMLGAVAGNSAITGNNNTCVGYNAQVAATTSSNSVTLGSTAVTVLRCQVTTITSTSDARDKKDVRPMDNGLQLIRAVEPVHFVWDMRDGGQVGNPDTGFIAQQLLQAQDDAKLHIPGLVYDINPDRLEAGYGKLLPVVVSALKELDGVVTSLKAQVAELTAELNTLKGT